MRNPAPCMNGAYFKWSDSLRAVGGEEYPFGYLHCLAIRPMNWLELVVFTGTGKLQSQTQTCISKHPASGCSLQFHWTLGSSNRAPESGCELSRHS